MYTAKKALLLLKTKDEVDALIASVQIDIDENKLNAMLTEVLG